MPAANAPMVFLGNALAGRLPTRTIHYTTTSVHGQTLAEKMPVVEVLQRSPTLSYRLWSHSSNYDPESRTNADIYSPTQIRSLQTISSVCIYSGNR
jgi:hypothetical protein